MWLAPESKAIRATAGRLVLARLGGPKGLAVARGNLYVVDTENHAIRRIELETGIITTVLGTGQRGDGPEPDPLRCRLHGRTECSWIRPALSMLETAKPTVFES